MQDHLAFEYDERAERRARIWTRITSFGVALAMTAATFFFACWIVSRSIGWMFER